MVKQKAQIPHKAYSRACLTTAKTRQIVMLYDGVLRNVMQAQEAIEHGDPETRFQKLMRASEIVQALQSSLDFDAEPDIAQTLHDYYASIDAQIIAALNGKDITLLEALSHDLRAMRRLWADIDHKDAADHAAAGEKSAPLDQAEIVKLSV